jgi:hypothetical protein
VMLNQQAQRGDREIGCAHEDDGGHRMCPSDERVLYSVYREGIIRDIVRTPKPNP